MSSFLEQFMGAGFASVVGDPAVGGIIFMGMFTIGTFLLTRSLDAKVAIIVPASLLALVFIPWLAVLLGLGVGVLLYIAIMALTGR